MGRLHDDIMVKLKRFVRATQVNAVAIICLLVPVNADCLAQARAAKIDVLMRTLSQRDQFSGSILVAEQGRIIYEHGFGKAEIKRNVAFTPHTLSIWLL
jgi:CubicO group peptidase (beta-lactamase class C family)